MSSVVTRTRVSSDLSRLRRRRQPVLLGLWESDPYVSVQRPPVVVADPFRRGRITRFSVFTSVEALVAAGQTGWAEHHSESDETIRYIATELLPICTVMATESVEVSPLESDLASPASRRCSSPCRCSAGSSAVAPSTSRPTSCAASSAASSTCSHRSPCGRPNRYSVGHHARARRSAAEPVAVMAESATTSVQGPGTERSTPPAPRPSLEARTAPLKEL